MGRAVEWIEKSWPDAVDDAKDEFLAGLEDEDFERLEAMPHAYHEMVQLNSVEFVSDYLRSSGRLGSTSSTHITLRTAWSISSLLFS